MQDLKNINGKEIIDFLNKITSEDTNELADISIEGNSFVFESQKILDNRYKLYFTASFNNWGTSQAISDNLLVIDEHGLRFSLEEPFEGDGTDEALRDVLKKWLETHNFNTNKEEEFDKLVNEAQVKLTHLSFGDTEGIQEIIDKLTEAKTWI